MTSASPLRSWLASANDHPEFPLENLPIGIFSQAGDTPRGGIAIGDSVFDLAAACAAEVFEGPARDAAEAASAAQLNAFFGLPGSRRRALRSAVQALLRADSAARERLQALGERLLVPRARCRLHLPARVGDYSDFYVGIHHATNVGKLFRPDTPLLPNYKYVPIGYHGRASTLAVSGGEVIRPRGQTLPQGAQTPLFGPSRRLDYELELGVWIGPGNVQGEPIPIGTAAEHLAGLCLLNDWSARDIQAWEYQPLGPFLSKSFATTLSPWVVMPEALLPFRIAQPERPAGDPPPLPYLFDADDQRHGAFDIRLEVLLSTAAMRDEARAPLTISQSNARYMYWTVAQMIAHHTVNGCALNPGDLLGSGTLSGPEPGSVGSLLELTQGGRQPLTLPNGETRTFLEDGDEIILRARCVREGHAAIGFGDCRARVVPTRN